VRAATTFKSMCAQVGNYFGEPDPATFGQPVGSEDCLYLNVWRPNSSADNLPVVFWVHGGGMVWGSAKDDQYNGAKLANKGNMVVVTVQYRLGMLGNLSHPALKTGNALDDSGDFAVLDLIRGLDWVQTNIRAFGGNPNSVTYAGQSAGCVNGLALLQSPLSVNKMHRLFCMSGVPLVSSPSDGTKAGNALIDLLLVDQGRASTPDQAAAQRAAMSNTQIATMLKSATAAQIMKFTPQVPPVNFMDGTVIRTGGPLGYNKLPMVLGSVRDEASLFLFIDGAGKPAPKEVWRLMNYVPSSSLTVSDLIKPEWLDLYVPAYQTASSVLSVTLDALTATLRLTNGADRIYRYNFNWNDTPQPWNTVFGAMHAIDVPFLFGNFVTDQPSFGRFAWNSGNAESRQALSEEFMSHFITFVRTDRPSQPFDGSKVWWADWSNLHSFPKRMVFDKSMFMSNQ
jgi:para-nitrobenzyl esterase